MTNIILYIVYGLVTFIGLTTLLNGILINIIFFIFRYKNIETLRTFLGGFMLWIGLAYLWKLISKTQMPQLAIVMCIIGLFVSLKMTSKLPDNNPSEATTKTIFSQIFSLVIILIASFFIYENIKWL